MFLKRGIVQGDDGDAAVSPLSGGRDRLRTVNRFLSIFKAIAKLHHPIRKARASI
jgi:hypothetical protein